MTENATKTRVQIQIPPEVLGGQFGQIVLVNRSIIGWSDGTISAYLFLRHEKGEKKIMQLLVNSSPLWGGKEMKSELDAWNDNEVASPLTVRSVRGLPITKMLAESKRISQASQDAVDQFGFIPAFSFSQKNGLVLGFKSMADFASTVDQVSAAVQYVNAINAGAANPVRILADNQFDGDLQQARNKLSAARRNGFLTRGEKGSGRIQGELTPKAIELLDDLKDIAEMQGGAV